jgi:hypothetical protein
MANQIWWRLLTEGVDGRIALQYPDIVPFAYAFDGGCQTRQTCAHNEHINAS